MESGGAVIATATTADLSSSTNPAEVVSRWTFTASQRFQHFLEVNTVLALPVDRILRRRNSIRVLSVQGFYVVSYALGIYILSLLIGFLSPQVDPEFLDGGPSLPTRNSDEFRPFVRRLPEFKFWYSITKAFCIAFVLTFFSILDLPVFWPTGSCCLRSP